MRDGRTAYRQLLYADTLMNHPPLGIHAHSVLLCAWSCAAVLSLIAGQVIAEAPANPVSSMQVFACDHPLVVRIDGIPPLGEEDINPEVRTCGLGLPGRIELKEPEDPEYPAQIRHDPADFPYSTPFELPYFLTLREGKLDVHLELRTTNNRQIVYETKSVPLDAKHLRLQPINGTAGPELALSVSALHDGVDHVGLNVINTPVNQFLSELTRVKKLQVQHAELVAKNRITYVMDSAVSVSEVMSLISDLSDVPVKRHGDQGYSFVEFPPHHDDIQKLRKKAAGYRRSGDKTQLKAALKQILLLGMPQRADEPVGNEFAEFSVLVMADQSTPRTEPPSVGQIAQIERELGPLQHPEYADVLTWQERQKDEPSKEIRELALAILEKYPNAKTLPESAGLMADFERSAIYAEHWDEAELWSRRLNLRLSDTKRGAWDKDLLKQAFGQAGEAEQSFGTELDLSKRYAAAEIHDELALTYKEVYFGTESRRTDDARNSVIENAYSQGKTERVIDYESRQIVLSAKRKNSVSDYYAYDLLDVVRNRALQGDLDRVIPLWQSVIDLRCRVRGDRSAPVVAGLKVLETLYRQNEQWADAAETEKKIVAMASADRDGTAAPTLRQAVEQAMTNDRAPMLICSHGQEIEKNTASKPLSKAHHSEQCGEYAVNRDATMAEAYFEEAIRLRKATQGKDHPDTRRTADRAIEVAMRTGNRDGADRVRALMAQP